MNLGERIAKLRTEHHLSQGDLAEKLGVSRQSISKWETGSSIPDLYKLVALSELFVVTLDSLVREEEPKEATDFKSLIAQQSDEKYPTRKIAGWILMGIGLLSMIIGLALNLIVAVLGSYLLLCGIICHTIKKHPGLVIGWGTFLPCAYFLPWFTSANMKMVFHPYLYQGGFTIQLIVSYTFWAVLFLLVFITIKNTRVRKYPFLFCGWTIFSQVYGFIPIAFRHTEETIYLVLSWCTNIFFIVLVFFTVKYLYNYYLISRRTL